MPNRFRSLAFALSLVPALVPACADRAQHAVALYDTGDYAGAAHAADQGIAAHPDDDSLWQMRIRAALAQGDGAGIASTYAGYRKQRGDDDHELLRELSIATLKQALASPSAKLQMAAITAVADAEMQDLADVVAKLMDSRDDRVAASAAVAVLRGGYPQATDVADAALKSEDPDARRIAIDGIGAKVGKYAGEDLERAAGDADPRVRRAAIRWLGQTKDKDAVELLTRRLHDKDEAVRAAAATALAYIGVGDLAAFAKTALADHALAVRIAAIDLLVAAHANDQLLALADDADPIVALQAAMAIHATQPAAAQRALARAVAAPEWTTRAGAANLAVAAIGKDAGLEVAHRLLADPNIGVRLAAARAVARTQPSEAAAVFVAALGDAANELEAAADLADQHDARGTDVLDKLVRDAHRTADQRAAAATAHRTAHVITPGVVAALADSSPVVRVEAAGALAALTK